MMRKHFAQKCGACNTNDNRYITEDKPVSDEVPFLPRRDAAQVGTYCLATRLCVVSRLLIGGEVILAAAMSNPGSC